MKPFLNLAAALCVLTFVAGQALAQEGPDNWQVTGVSAGDTVCRAINEDGGNHSGGGGRDVTLTGSGSANSGGLVNGRIAKGELGGKYALSLTMAARGIFCSGLLQGPPGSARLDNVRIACTNCRTGNAVVAATTPATAFR